MIRKPDSFWLSLVARLWPGVLTPPRENQVNAAADLLGIVLGLPFALGALPDLSWRCERIGLAPGDVVTLYTDGLTDALDESGEFYGQTRLESVVGRFDNGTAQAARNLLQADIADFRADAPLADDITLVIVRRDPLAQSPIHPGS